MTLGRERYPIRRVTKYNMKVAAYVGDKVMDLSPAHICQLFYVLSAAAVLAVAAVPHTAQQLLTRYGARSSRNTSASTSSEGRKESGRELDDNDLGPLFRLISCLTSVGQIPHSWFIHFYILSLSCTIFWAIQFVMNGTVLELIVKSQLARCTSSMTMGQVVLVWVLMGLQGARRLYEYLAVLQPSSSSMWIIHWLLGNGFYLCTSVSIWVEGSRAIQCSGQSCSDVEFPPLKSVIASFVFLIAWFMQYRCHRYLAGLRKYSLPNEGLFRYLVCPHYTCECLIYLSMAVLAAPEGQFYNRTLACACLFVSVNLGLTANGTKIWYGEKFGKKIQGKWKMIPIVF
ncbi:hypothetical protein F4782DRAFT_530039 [Xylaria castorea]|nr:hypothetical protein F4782DRAFT_530039 [Xylaria castorea]